MTTYTVTAERGSPALWVFQCVEHPGAISQSRRLADVDVLMREAIAFVAEVDETSFDIRLDVVLPDSLGSEVESARRAVDDLERLQRETAALSRKAAVDLVGAGLSGADAARVLGVSPQRVSQLVNS